MRQKAKNLIIKTKKTVFSEYLANHPSLFDGDGMDFSELREYRVGDDAKKLDYKTTAKKQTPYVKVYKSERELNIVVFNLLGGSVYFGTKLQKQELLAQILSTIGVATVSYQDRFSSYIFTDKIESIIKPSKKLSFVTKAVEEVLKFNPVGKILNLKNLQSQIKKHIKKKSILIMIGDFFDIVDFKRLNTYHEVLVIIVRDRFEEKLEDINLINLLDASTKQTLSIDLNQSTIKSYQKAIKQHDHQLYQSLKKDKIKFIKIYTDQNPTKELKKLFF